VGWAGSASWGSKLFLLLSWNGPQRGTRTICGTVGWSSLFPHPFAVGSGDSCAVGESAGRSGGQSGALLQGIHRSLEVQRHKGARPLLLL
jgi:hypothetical protein